MFTGIVQGLGEVLAVDQRAPDFRSHTVRLPEGADADLRVGASVAHNGCCLTITRIHENGAADFDLMGETLAKTKTITTTNTASISIISYSPVYPVHPSNSTHQ